MKRISTFFLGPKVPERFQNKPHDYILCDSENNIKNFTYGLTLDYGYFPKMFLGNSKNSLFAKSINIDVLSIDFSDK